MASKIACDITVPLKYTVGDSKIVKEISLKKLSPHARSQSREKNEELISSRPNTVSGTGTGSRGRTRSNTSESEIREKSERSLNMNMNMNINMSREGKVLPKSSPSHRENSERPRSVNMSRESMRENSERSLNMNMNINMSREGKGLPKSSPSHFEANEKSLSLSMSRECIRENSEKSWSTRIENKIQSKSSNSYRDTGTSEKSWSKDLENGENWGNGENKGPRKLNHSGNGLQLIENTHSEKSERSHNQKDKEKERKKSSWAKNMSPTSRTCIRGLLHCIILLFEPKRRVTGECGHDFRK